MAIIQFKNTPKEGTYFMLEGKTTHKPVDGLEAAVKPLTVARDDKYLFGDSSKEKPILEGERSNIHFVCDDVLSIDGKIRLPCVTSRGFSANVIERERGKYLVASLDESLGWFCTSRSYKVLEILASMPSIDLHLNPKGKGGFKGLKEVIERVRDENNLPIGGIRSLSQEEAEELDSFSGMSYPIIDLVYTLVQHYESLEKELTDFERIIIGRVGIPGVELPLFAKHNQFSTLGTEKLIELLNATPKDSNGNSIQEGDRINILINHPEMPDSRVQELLQKYR